MNCENNNGLGTNNDARSEIVKPNEPVQQKEAYVQGELKMTRTKEIWLPEEAIWLVDHYKIFEGEIGRKKKFATKTALCDYLSQEFKRFFNRTKTAQQISNRIITILRQRKNSANSVKSPVYTPMRNEVQSIVKGPSILLASAISKPPARPNLSSSDFVARLIQGWSSNGAGNGSRMSASLNRSSTVGVASIFGECSSVSSSNGTYAVGCNRPAIVGLPSASIRPLSNIKNTSTANSVSAIVGNGQNSTAVTGFSRPGITYLPPASLGPSAELGSVVAKQSPSTNFANRVNGSGSISIPGSSTENSDNSMNEEKRMLLDLYNVHISEVGPSGIFKDKKSFWQYIAGEMNSTFSTNKSYEEVARECNIIMIQRNYGWNNDSVGMNLETKMLLHLHDTFISQIGPCEIFEDKKAFWKYIKEEINVTFNSNKTSEQVERDYNTIQTNDGCDNDSVGLNSNKWTNPESTMLLDLYAFNMDEVGPFGLFRLKKELWNYIARKINSNFGVKKTWEQVESRYKCIIRAKKLAVDFNKTSGAGRMDVEYRDEVNKITSRDDSIEPEVIRGVGCVKYKENTHNKNKNINKPRWAKPTKKGILNNLSESFLLAEKRKAGRDEDKESRRDKRHRDTLEVISMLLKKD